VIKVFLSSTFEDLTEHRKAVLEVLHRMKADVQAMEYFGSRPDGPESACTQEISECDVLLGIYAWRYGWQPDPEGPSITEQEFEWAVQSGKKCLCYRIDPEFPWKKKFIDSGPAGDRLARFKTKVGQLVVSNFTSPDDLAKRVAADLGNLLRKIAPPTLASPLAVDWGSVPGAVRKELMEILSHLPEIEPLRGDSAGRTRFVARPEFFGSLIFDREQVDYIAFDQDATDILRLLATKSLDQVFERLRSKVQRTVFERFTALCQSVGMLDAQGRFAGAFIEDLRPPSGRLSAPTRVHFSCTNACNFRCRHCYASSGNPYAGELTTQEVHRLIDELADMGCFHLSLGGGEPLVRADLPEIIRKANRRGVAVRIATNAAAATEDVVRALRGLKIDTFKVSFEGSSESVYDAVRGEAGAFRAAVRGIENLKLLAVPIELHRVFMKGNTGDLESLVAWANDHALSKLILETVMPVGRAAEHAGLTLSEEETNHLWQQASALQATSRCPIEMPHRDPFTSRRLFKNVGCECGNMVCHVDPIGNVAATGMARAQAPAGNLRRNSLREIWNSDTAFDAFRTPCASSRCAVREATAAAG